MALTEFDGGSGPRIHALVIGIGRYDHLNGGAGKQLPNPLNFGNPGQLTSPPRSALAVAAAMQSPDLEWVVPLGTIDILTSHAPGDSPPGDGSALVETTRDAIQTAFDQWWERCDSNPGNVAFFYVAGHGVQGWQQIVLASDFGQSQGQPWWHAFDVDATRDALKANRAHTQLFFVDACRRVTLSNVETPNPGVPALRPPEARQPENCIHDLTMRATGRSRDAKGPTGSPSYFASALVEGLGGGAAAKHDGEWWIATDKLSARFNLLMERAGVSTDEQRSETTGFTTPFRLAKLKAAPPAQLELACRPDDATPLADLHWRHWSGHHQRRPQPSSEAWRVDVEPGLGWVSATFSGREYLDCLDQDVVVEPPLTRERVRLQ